MASTEISRQTGLKATTWTTAIEIIGRGSLRGLGWQDADTQAGNEEIRMTIDGTVTLTVAKNVGAMEYFDLVQSIITDAVVNVASATDSETLRTVQRIPFHRQLKIEYKRASAGTNGLSITTFYEIKA